VIFWDTSAIVPLLVEEPSSSTAAALLRSDSELVVWWGLSIECLSAIARRERARDLPPEGADQARAVLEALARTWVEVAASDSVRAHATRVLRRHPLRAADALALGAALVWSADAPERRQLATLDGRLGAAARREGFRLPLEPRE
jgi:predicted nucleic acid-binding protein